ncbi:hypothetical protein SAMN05444338_101129 [Flavobacterium degerlachei]|uniref:Uncharacterized protein n=1 Tax=Flavobacterium degerlachei TaxID=229203 RepID=A0A1H2QBE0_9FLAO|nr:hypothetical protein SAMN05444338_101129 [Flavobacterium degerlachei]
MSKGLKNPRIIINEKAHKNSLWAFLKTLRTSRLNNSYGAGSGIIA